VCGRGIYFEREGVLEYDPGDRCIDCGHCMALCPRDALVLEDGSLPPRIERERLPGAQDLLHFFRTRRSARRFKKDVPPPEVLDRLMEAARYAPTGSNKQAVNVVMIVDPALIDGLRKRIMARYGDYERHLANPVKRFFLKAFVDRRLGDPGIRRYLERFMSDWRAGRDVLFHEAPVAALLHAGRGATTPKDDCVIALTQMTLLAERVGLGSCMLGTVERAFDRTPDLYDLVGIPRDCPIHAAACFGYPRLKFRRLAERKEVGKRIL